MSREHRSETDHAGRESQSADTEHADSEPTVSLRDQWLGDIAARHGTMLRAGGGGPPTFRDQSLRAIAAAFGDRVGASDDHHERQADQRADAAVAEPSAEELRDQLVGGIAASPAGAIQRKDTDGATRENKIRNEVVRTSLLLTQFWFDSAVERARGHKGKLDAATARTTFANAVRSLGEAWNAAEHVVKFDKTVFAQMHETTDAYLEYLELVVISDDPKVSGSSELKQLSASITALRNYMGLGGMTKHKRHRTTRGTKHHYEGMAIGPVLDLIAVEAGQIFTELVNHSDRREEIIDDPGSTLDAHLARAIFLIQSHDDTRDVRAFAQQVEAASASVLKIHAWIHMREDNAGLMSMFQSTHALTDQLRKLIGLGSLTSMDAPRMPQSEVEEADKETMALEAAEKNFVAALRAAFVHLAQGADRFNRLSALKRPPPQTNPSFFEEITKDILISVIGNIAGPVMGAIARRLQPKLEQLGLNAAGFFHGVEGTTVDSIEAIAGQIAEHAFSAGKSDNEDVRRRQRYVESIVLTQAKLDLASEQALNAKVRDKRISAAEIEAMTHDLNKGAPLEEIANIAYREAAHGYAQDVLRKSVGVQTNANGQTVSNLDHYVGLFIQSDPDRFPVAVDVKAGSTGIAKLSVEVFDYGIAGTKVNKFEIHGMNDDMALAIMEKAEYRIDKIGLPMEIELTASWGQHRPGRYNKAPRATALIVVDEAGTIRHRAASDGFYEGPVSDYLIPARNADFYSTPEKLWNAIRHDTVPKDAAKITPGG